MRFTINEKIKTELHYKDIALITVAIGEYKRLYKDTAVKEVLQRMSNLVNRLGVEMCNHPQIMINLTGIKLCRTTEYMSNVTYTEPLN